MRIEDEIRERIISAPARHKDVLRARLLAHMEESTMKKSKRSFRWPLVAVPVMAVLLLAVLSVWQFAPNNSPGVVQKTLEPLTAKQVFAAARAHAEKEIPQVNQVYYSKVLRMQYSGNCSPYSDYILQYTDSNSVLRKVVITNRSGQVTNMMHFSETGSPVGESYSDQSVMDPAVFATQDLCPKDQTIDQASYDKFFQHLEAIAKAYEYVPSPDNEKGLAGGAYLAYADLRSGNPTRQVHALDVLSKIDGWQVKEDIVRTEIGNGPLIELSFMAGDYFEKIYFYSETKQFAGEERLGLNEGWFPVFDIVVDQGVRPLSEIE